MPFDKAGHRVSLAGGGGIAAEHPPERASPHHPSARNFTVFFHDAPIHPPVLEGREDT